MAAKLELIEEPGYYVTLLYEDGPLPIMKTFFLYLSQEKRQEARQKSEDFAKTMSKSLKIPLEILVK